MTQMTDDTPNCDPLRERNVTGSLGSFTAPVVPALQSTLLFAIGSLKMSLSVSRLTKDLPSSKPSLPPFTHERGFSCNVPERKCRTRNKNRPGDHAICQHPNSAKPYSVLLVPVQGTQATSCHLQLCCSRRITSLTSMIHGK